MDLIRLTPYHWQPCILKFCDIKKRWLYVTSSTIRTRCSIIKSHNYAYSARKTFTYSARKTFLNKLSLLRYFSFYLFILYLIHQHYLGFWNVPRSMNGCGHGRRARCYQRIIEVHIPDSSTPRSTLSPMSTHWYLCSPLSPSPRGGLAVCSWRNRDQTISSNGA